MNRVIGVIDSDAFEVSVYQKLPEFTHTIGQPCVVSAGENSSRIVSVSTEAKTKGVSRSMTVQQAKQKNSDLMIIPKGNRFDKQDSQPQRIASYKLRNKVMQFLHSQAPECCFDEHGENRLSNVTVEISGNDEFYLDLTRAIANSLNDCLSIHPRVILECSRGRFDGRGLLNIRTQIIMNHNENRENVNHLLYGAEIVRRLCEYIKQTLGIKCSGGVGNNKLTAKLACKLHKPEGIVALSAEGMLRVSSHLDFRQIPQLGGQLGERVSQIINSNISAAQLRQICNNKHSSERAKLRETLEISEINKITNLLHGIDNEIVEHRVMNTKVSSGKDNLHFNVYDGIFRFKKVIHSLSKEITERILEEMQWNKRIAINLKFHYDHRVNKCQPYEKESFELRDFLFGASPDSILEETWRVAVSNNARFENHLSFINGVRFTVTKFDMIDELFDVLGSKVQ